MIRPDVTQGVRFTASKDELLKLLHEVSYPHTIWKEDPSLLDECILCEIFTLNSEGRCGPSVGYVWAHFVAPGEMTCHAAVRPGGTFLWALILPQLLHLAWACGADTLILSFDDTPRKAPLSRLMARLGFQAIPGGYLGRQTAFRRDINICPHSEYQNPRPPLTG